MGTTTRLFVITAEAPDYRLGSTRLLYPAAAATMGSAAVPVYQIYKAGAAPHWLDGLDLLGALGLKVAVIPHCTRWAGGPRPA